MAVRFNTVNQIERSNFGRHKLAPTMVWFILVLSNCWAQSPILSPEDYLQHERLHGFLSPSGRWAISNTFGAGGAIRRTHPSVEMIDTRSPIRRFDLSFSSQEVLVAQWSPDEKYVAILEGTRGSFRVEIVQCSFVKPVWSSDAFSTGAGGRNPAFQWVTNDRFVLQAERIGDEVFARLALTRGSAERVQGWQALLNGEDSATAVDTREPVQKQLAVDVWLGDIGTKKLTKFFRCPEATAISVSPGWQYVGIISRSEWTSIDEGVSSDTKIRSHSGDWFTTRETPKLILHTPDLFYSPVLVSQPVWTSPGETWLVVRHGRAFARLQIKFDAGAARANEIVLPEKLGEPRSWCFFKEFMFVQGAQGNNLRWWAIDGDKVIPFTELIPGPEPEDVIPVMTGTTESELAVVSARKVLAVEMNPGPTVTRTIELPVAISLTMRRRFLPFVYEPWRSSTTNGGAVFLLASSGEALLVNVPDGTVRVLADGSGLWGISARGSFVEVIRKRGVSTLSVGTATTLLDLRIVNAVFAEKAVPPAKVLIYKPDRLPNGVTGECCREILYLPPGSDQPKPLPLVVSIYLERKDPQRLAETFMDIQTAPGEDPRLYTSHGYAFMIPAMPWTRGRNAGDAIDAVEAYVLPAIAEAVKSGWVDPDRIAFVGESMGGLNVLQLLTRTRIAKAAISAVGLFNLMAEWGSFKEDETLASNAFPLLSEADLVEGNQIGMKGPPWEDVDQYLRNSPDTHVANIKTPVLLLKGDQDYVSQGASQYAFMALKRVGVPVRLVLFHGEGHALASGANLAREAREILDWLDLYIGNSAKNSK